jgi:hypothetical protein
MTSTHAAPQSAAGIVPTNELRDVTRIGAKHTPGTWEAQAYTGHARTTILAEDGTAIAETSGFGRPADECAVDAAHIVRCVNAHDALVAALRECMSCMDSLRDYAAEGGGRMVGVRDAIRDADKAFDAARAALAKVDA